MVYLLLFDDLGGHIFLHCFYYGHKRWKAYLYFFMKAEISQLSHSVTWTFEVSICH